MLKQSSIINSYLLPFSLMGITLLYINYINEINWFISLLITLFVLAGGLFERLILKQSITSIHYLPNKNIIINILFIAFSIFIAYHSHWIFILLAIIYLIVVQSQFVFFNYNLQIVGHLITSFLKNYIPILMLFYAHFDFVPFTLVRISLIFFIPQFLNIWDIFQYFSESNSLKDNFYNRTLINQYSYPLMILSVLTSAIFSYPTVSWFSLIYLLLIPVYFSLNKENVPRNNQRYIYYFTFSTLNLIIWSLAI